MEERTVRGWEKNIRKVVPYVPGEQPKDKDIIKLNTNENPYDPAPAVLAKKMDLESLRKYPDPKIEKLVNKLAEYHNVKPSQVFTGIGSDDVIAMCFMTFFNSEKKILFPDVTYSFYDVWADMLKIPYEAVPVDENFNIVKEDYYKENGGIIFPNPNAPTGILVGLDFIKDILDHNRDVIVIVDEAYIDFGGKTALSLIDEYDNLIITRTFSKSRSLAGLRIGYAISNETLIKYLNDVKYSFNSYTLNTLSIELGVASVEDEEYFRETVNKIITTRESFTEKIKALGFEVLPSSSNFVFAKHPKYSGEYLFEELRKDKVFVRHFSGERIKEYLRITIGTDEEMAKLLGLLEKLVK